MGEGKRIREERKIDVDRCVSIEIKKKNKTSREMGVKKKKERLKEKQRD